ncbi:SHC-transforming protein 1-like isoform X2 [Limulus polyphemus]|uniref:SHC-transforming protein 1-like isoform X2 n=1 Tax=Limulus polyphemus TaxID=6850 RepID=A0ABM1T153_LIMPO|nr:SHC-transforming protein 1-like isoform X2 [Limulus polyphemus]
MLRCFLFAYHNLKEEDYCHMPLGDSSVRTFRKPDAAAILSRSKPSSTLSESLPTVQPKIARHIEKQEVFRKAADLFSAHQGPEFADRYTRFTRSLSKVSDTPGHRTDMSRMGMCGNTNLSGFTGGWNFGSGEPDSFINKPPSGWLHSEQEVRKSGVCYELRYVGCLEVNTSMKSLDFDTRSQIAKECINRVCEAAGLKTSDKKRKVDKRISRMLSQRPNLDYAGSNVNLIITSSCLSLIVIESGEDTLDSIAYVAKDQQYGRACFVLECGGSLSQEVITTIGQAFEMRLKEFLQKTTYATNSSESHKMENPAFSRSQSFRADDPEYYNDIPGKIPPEEPPLVPPLPDYHAAAHNGGETEIHCTTVKQSLSSFASKSSASNSTQAMVLKQKGSTLLDKVIDLDHEGVPTNHLKQPEPEYVNTTKSSDNKDTGDLALVCISQPSTSLSPLLQEPPVSKAPFDMRSFEHNLSSNQHPFPPSTSCHGPLVSNKTTVHSPLKSVSPSNLKTVLQQEEWFHGPVSRKDSEALVVHDGDFLVRESQGSPDQYVLTGMKSGQRKQLLLVDPEGVVRTKDRTFESVSHLIHYHHNNSLPIISAESALFLRTAIPRTLK